MRFLENQESARKRTTTLLVQFVLVAIPALAFTLAIGLAIGLFFTWIELGLLEQAGYPFAERNPELYIVGALVHAMLFLLAVIRIKHSQLVELSDELAQDLSQQRREGQAHPSTLTKIRNVVEEMALAAGMPAPRVELWPHYHVINSITIGQGPADATIFITETAVEGLPRAELQALVAYSMSQILNGDMMLNMRLAAYVHTFGFGPRIARRLVSTPKPSSSVWASRDTDQMRWILWFCIRLPLGLAMSLFVWPQYIAGRFLQLQVGKERQRLGDASAIQFTRDRKAYYELLFKTLAFSDAGKLEPYLQRLIAHFTHCCFMAPDTNRFFAIQDSLSVRLRLFNPRIQAPEAWKDRLAKMRLEVRERIENERRARIPIAGAQEEPTKKKLGELLQPIVAAALADPLAPIAKPRMTSIDDSCATILALLLDRNPRVRSKQLAILKSKFGDVSMPALMNAFEAHGTLAPTQRSIELDRQLPSLRGLERFEIQETRDAVRALEAADDNVDVFEYVLARSVLVFIDGVTTPRKPHGSLTLDVLSQQIHLTFAVLASFTSKERAAHAFEAGMRHLGVRAWDAYAEPRGWTTTLDKALASLDDLTPVAKNLLLEGLGKTAVHDGFNTQSERELIRAIGAAIHCPIPRTGN